MKNKPFDYKEFLKREDIKEHTAYLVKVSYCGNNPIHEAILFMGFKSGSYCYIYANNYGSVKGLNDAYTLEVIKELYTFKD